jgi:hypothetical protein
MADLPNTIEEIFGTILDVIGGCEEANKSQNADEYDEAAQDALFHWQQPVLHITEIHPDLFSLNNLLSSLTLDQDEFKQNYRDNLLDLYRTCCAYEPFEDLLQGDYGISLNSFFEEMMRDVDTDGEMEDDVEDDGGVEDN